MVTNGAGGCGLLVQLLRDLRAPGVGVEKYYFRAGGSGRATLLRGRGRSAVRDGAGSLARCRRRI